MRRHGRPAPRSSVSAAPPSLLATEAPASGTSDDDSTGITRKTSRFSGSRFLGTARNRSRRLELISRPLRRFFVGSVNPFPSGDHPFVKPFAKIDPRVMMPAMASAAAIGFDVYGTLVDPLGISEELRRFVGDDADRVAQLWRTTQLEYSWRRSLMDLYEPFSLCTAQALDFAARSLGHQLAPAAAAKLQNAYRQLPAFPDAVEGLTRMNDTGHRMVAFSNGEAASVRAVLTHAGLIRLFADVVSVDEVKTYKPAPVAYRHLAARAGTAMRDTWLVSSNPFDVIGAKAAGLRTAWVRRNPRAILDPWEIEADLVVADLIELSGRLDVS